MKANEYIISNEKFVFASNSDNLHDKALETKPVSYFRDAFNRFCKNKASIIATFIIGFLVIFAIIGPMLTPYTVAYKDENYKFARPRNQLFYDLGIPFWDGGTEKEVNQLTYDLYRAIEIETGRPVIMGGVDINEQEYMGKISKLYSFRLDTYTSVGVKYVLLSTEEYEALQKYQDDNNVQVILPITESTLRPAALQDKTNANFWFKTTKGKGGKTEIVYDKDGNFIPIYQAANGKDYYTSKMYWEGDEKLYNYAEPKDGGMWNVRVDYQEYYTYKHHIAGDGITTPSYLFGANDAGKDIFTCLASGARFSFILAIVVSAVNLFVGAIYGAIEGYYGGKIDLLMERFVDILASVPFMIVITLLKYHFNVSHIIILFTLVR